MACNYGLEENICCSRERFFPQVIVGLGFWCAVVVVVAKVAGDLWVFQVRQYAFIYDLQQENRGYRIRFLCSINGQVMIIVSVVKVLLSLGDRQDF